jgi:hypothetical protein
MHFNDRGTGGNEVQETWRYGPCTFVMDLLCGDSDTKWLMRATELDSHIPQLIIHNLDHCLAVACENLNYSSATRCRLYRRAELLGLARRIAVGNTGFRFRKSTCTLLAEVKEYVAKCAVRTVVLVKMLALRYVSPCWLENTWRCFEESPPFRNSDLEHAGNKKVRTFGNHYRMTWHDTPTRREQSRFKLQVA